jgi:hypothetical protein
MFRPYLVTRARILEKQHLRFEHCHGPVLYTHIYFFMVMINDVIYDEPETSKIHWEQTQVGDQIYIAYRTSWIHQDVKGGRDVQSFISTHQNVNVWLKIIPWLPLITAICLYFAYLIF